MAETDPPLDDLLARHFSRFQASHARARAQAGPSLFGADRAVDHWTLDYARRAIDAALADAVEAALARPQAAAAVAPALRRFVDQVIAALEADAGVPTANEYGLRPAPAALEAVRRHAATQLSAALGGLARGQLDQRLRRPRGRLPAGFGGAPWLLAVAGLILVLLALAAF